MAEDKQNTGPEGTVPGEPEAESTIPGTDPKNTPTQDNGDVVIDFDKINQLMAERRAAAREEVEKTGDADLPEPGEHSEDGQPLPEPEEHSEDGPPLPEPEEHSEDGPPLPEPEEHSEDGPPLPKPEEHSGDGPLLPEPEEHSGDGQPRSSVGDTVKDPAPGKDSGQPLKTAQEELDVKGGKKSRRGRPPKSEKSGPEAGDQGKASGKPRKERQPKPDKAPPEQGKGERDKVGLLTK